MTSIDLCHLDEGNIVFTLTYDESTDLLQSLDVVNNSPHTPSATITDMNKNKAYTLTVPANLPSFSLDLSKTGLTYNNPTWSFSATSQV